MSISRRSFSDLTIAAWLIASSGGCGQDYVRTRDDSSTGVRPYFIGEFVGSDGGLISVQATDDAGNSSISCIVNADCDDGNACTGIETCMEGLCRPSATPKCFDGDPCTTDVCVPATDTCIFETAPNGTACADGNLCDGQTCLNGACVAGRATVCAVDSNLCSVHACDPATGDCTATTQPDGAGCSDGDACNGDERCSGGVCLAGPPLSCNDGNPCTTDACYPGTGCLNTVLADGTACPDGNLCNGNELCGGGVCLPGLAPTCDDRNTCTTDSCVPATGGCVFAALGNGVHCADDNLCDGDTCSNGACIPGPAVVCANDNDGNPCTINTCLTATGVCAPGYAPDGATCSDGDVCNGTESCAAGHCSTPGTPLTCPDDGNPCTSSVCTPSTGCINLNVDNGTSCSDANPCNGAETCSAGTCLGGTPVICTNLETCNRSTGLCEQ